MTAIVDITATVRNAVSPDVSRRHDAVQVSSMPAHHRREHRLSTCFEDASPSALGALMTRQVRSIPRGLLLVALAFLLVSAGCADSTGRSASPAPGTAASSAVAETPLGACASIARNQGLSLSQSWAVVVGSKGSSEHARRVERFADDTEKAAGARYGEACADVGAMMGQLSSEAGRLAAWVLIGDGEAELSKYQAVAEAGNILMERLGVDQQFETDGLTGT
jgi:hypothetical protein